MIEKVKKCANSNLKEAWVALEGFPNSEKGNSLDDEISALVHNVRTIVLHDKKNYKDSQRIIGPFTEIPGKGVLPFWRTEFRWSEKDKNEKIIRAGNHFLSFHTMHNSAEQQYSSYNEELEPVIKQTIKKIIPNNSFLVKRIIFRYINIFYIMQQSFNLDDYFDVICSLRLGKKSIPLSGFFADFNFDSSQDNTVLNLAFKIQPMKDRIFLAVETTGSKELENERNVTNQQILNEIQSLKEETKDTFFSCTTEKTNKFLGVQYE